jgi:hypothetical protein
MFLRAVTTSQAFAPPFLAAASDSISPCGDMLEDTGPDGGSTARLMWLRSSRFPTPVPDTMTECRSDFPDGNIVAPKMP